MKHCFSNPNAVSTWFDRATKYQDSDIALEVHSAGNRIVAQGHKLYSYGKHFPMAQWFPDQQVFLTNTSERRSNTTSRHQSYVRRTGPNCIEVGKNIRLDPTKDFAQFYAEWNEQLRTALNKYQRARKHQNYWEEQVKNLLGNLNNFIQAFQLDAPTPPQDIVIALAAMHSRQV